MRSVSITSGLVGAAAAFSKLASAARACGSTNTSSTYVWRVGDARYDGADPKITNGTAVVAISIVPNSTSSFFECVAEWPESWAGRSPVDGNIIWSDCIWSGAGPTYDTAVSFALDWRNRTMYLSHTFSCSDRQGSVSIATGSFKLDLDCQNAEDESTHCSLKSKTANPTLQVSTVPSAPQLPATASCEDNAKAYQSWQLEDWHRQYRSAPGDITTPPAMDSGPSFTLRNMANGGVFKCAPSGNKTEANIFDGACTQAAGAGALATTTAAFQFDPALDLLSVTQRWECGNTSSFDASGIAFVQATCDRQGDMLTCTSLPLWVGTKTV